MAQKVSDKANKAKGQEQAGFHDFHDCVFAKGCGDDAYFYSLCVFYDYACIYFCAR